MRYFILTIFTVMIVIVSVYADDKEDALKSFYSYINAANSYSAELPNFYSPSAKIIRQVIKPDGSTVNVYTNTSTYFKQMKIGQAGAKLRSYKNNYTNVYTTTLSNGKVKISSIRHPSVDNDSLKAYMIFQKQTNGKWIIVEEMMQTRQQIFLKYANSN